MAGMLGGCNSDMPFELAPVHGKVSYDDGSLIKADSLEVAFQPVVATPGPITPPAGTAKVNVADGTFAAVTSRRRDDGLALGKHKVIVIAYNTNAKGNPAPSKAVPAKFQQASTTPLEVDVQSADQFIEIKVSKQ
jgi:hypothetical protein